MKKSFKLENLGCANCAAKIEREMNKLPGVHKASINFMMSKLILDAEEDQWHEILEQSQKIANKYEPDLKIIVR